MHTRLALTVGLLLTACTTTERIDDPRAPALTGDWRLEMRRAAGTIAASETGRIALVAVQRDKPTLLGDAHLLAAGAVTMNEGTIVRRIADGTRVEAYPSGRDSVQLRFSSEHGEYDVTLVGALRNDTISGVWQLVIGRSSGATGVFQVTRPR